MAFSGPSVRKVDAEFAFESPADDNPINRSVYGPFSCLVFSPFRDYFALFVAFRGPSVRKVDVEVVFEVSADNNPINRSV